MKRWWIHAAVLFSLADAGCRHYLPPVRAVTDDMRSEVGEGVAAVVLDDDRLVKNEVIGFAPLATEVVYRRIYIANRDGLSLASVQVPYGPREQIDHFNGRTVCPEGVVDVFDEKDVLHTELARIGGSGGGSYRAITYAFPGAVPGCTIEYAFERAQQRWVLSEHHTLDASLPIRHASYEVGGIGTGLTLNSREGGGFVPDAVEDHRWEARDIGAAGSEIFEPPPYITRPWVGFSLRWVKVPWLGFDEDFYTSWQSVAKSMWPSLQDFITEPPEALVEPPTGALAAEIERTWKEVQAKVADRAGLVDSGDETAARVFADGFGTANQRSLVLWSVFLDWGIPTGLVVVSDPAEPDISNDFPTPEAIDDMLVAVWPNGKDMVLLDPRCQGCAMGQLTSEHQGRQGVLIRAPRYLTITELDTVPELFQLPEDAERLSPPKLKLTAEITSRGLVARSGYLTARGAIAASLRHHFDENPTTEAELREVMRKRYLDGIEGGEIRLIGLEDHGADLIIAFEDLLVQRDAFVQTGPWLVVPLACLSREGWLAEFAEDRSMGVYFDPPPHFQHEFEITIPSGYHVAELPAAEPLTSPFGTYTLTAKRTGDAVIVEEALRLSTQWIPAERYADLYAFVQRVRQARRASVVLRK
jgi:hypothetical protein